MSNQAEGLSTPVSNRSRPSRNQQADDAKNQAKQEKLLEKVKRKLAKIKNWWKNTSKTKRFLLLLALVFGAILLAAVISLIWPASAAATALSPFITVGGKLVLSAEAVAGISGGMTIAATVAARCLPNRGNSKGEVVIHGDIKDSHLTIILGDNNHHHGITEQAIDQALQAACSSSGADVKNPDNSKNVEVQTPGAPVKALRRCMSTPNIDEGRQIDFSTEAMEAHAKAQAAAMDEAKVETTKTKINMLMAVLLLTIGFGFKKESYLLDSSVGKENRKKIREQYRKPEDKVSLPFAWQQRLTEYLNLGKIAAIQAPPQSEQKNITTLYLMEQFCNQLSLLIYNAAKSTTLNNSTREAVRKHVGYFLKIGTPVSSTVLIDMHRAHENKFVVG